MIIAICFLYTYVCMVPPKTLTVNEDKPQSEHGSYIDMIQKWPVQITAPTLPYIRLRPFLTGQLGAPSTNPRPLRTLTAEPQKYRPHTPYMRLRSAFPPPPPHGIPPPPGPPDASKVSTVTGMGPLGVAILVTVIVFDA